MSRKKYKLEINEEAFADGIDKGIALVEYGAICDPELDDQEGMHFLKFNSQQFKFQVIDEKQIITGPALIPNKLIYRMDEKTGEEFDVYFPEKTIRRFVELFFNPNNGEHYVNLDHDKAQTVNDVYIFESWIVENTKKDKSSQLGYEVPKGTWMVSMKVEDPELWKFIKQGKYNDFSIESYFSQKLMRLQQEQTITDEEFILQYITNNNNL